MLILQDVTCERGGSVLFRDLAFTFGDCGIFLIRGNNGTGKTSLLKVINCTLKPVKGKVLYANEEVTGKYFYEYCDIIEYIGHKNCSKEHLTLEENLTFWAQLKGNPEMVPAALSYFDLIDYKDYPVYKLSQGIQKRLALSRLLITESEIWLLDEPFTFLDEESKAKLAGLIQARADQGGTVIIATNDEVPLEGALDINIADWKS